MVDTHASPEDSNEPALYEIRIRGHLDDRWADRFEGLTLTRQENGETLLIGPVVDQAALHGVLRAVRNLGIPLLSVIHVQSELAERPKDGSQDASQRSIKETET